MTTRATRQKTLALLVAAASALLLYLVVARAPDVTGPGVTAPATWRLFFLHVPIALAAFAAFITALAHSISYLARPRALSDRRAHAANEVGVLLAGLTLLSGMIWARAEWGVWWRWDDAKLVIVLVMFLVYLASLVLRREIEEPERRARVLAVYSVAAFPTVPLAWFAQRIWLTEHPSVFGAERNDAGVSTAGVLPLFLFALVTILGLFVVLYRARVSQLERKEATP